MKTDRSSRLFICGTILLLGIFYWLCRCVFLDLHGMKQWTDILAVCALVVTLVSLLAKKPVLSAAAVFGYICGFGAGLLFNTDGVDPGGGRTNNMWSIWALGLLICIAAGIVIEIVLSIKKLRK